MWSDDEKRVCETLVQQTQDLLAWTWDDRFGCALAAFPVSKREDVLKILDRLMQEKWNDSNVHEAPRKVIQLGEDMGGLRRGQFLFTTGAPKDAFLFAAWWPWQDGQTVSLRIGPYSAGISPSEEEDLLTSFKACFGV